MCETLVGGGNDTTARADFEAGVCYAHFADYGGCAPSARECIEYAAKPGRATSAVFCAAAAGARFAQLDATGALRFRGGAGARDAGDPTSAHAACATAFDDGGAIARALGGIEVVLPPETRPRAPGAPPIRLDSEARRWLRIACVAGASRQQFDRAGAPYGRNEDEKWDVPAGASESSEREAFARQVLTPRRVSDEAAAAMCARLAPLDGDAFGACVETAVGGASCLASLPALLSGGEPRSAGWGAGAAAALRRR